MFVGWFVAAKVAGNVQVHPVYVLQFSDDASAMPVVHELKALEPPVSETVSI